MAEDYHVVTTGNVLFRGERAADHGRHGMDPEVVGGHPDARDQLGCFTGVHGESGLHHRRDGLERVLRLVLQREELRRGHS
jgi:hypothetical protein